MKIKNENGAITLFVLVSLLLFTITITSVYAFVQGKKGAISNEFKQIKSNYEMNDTELNKIYNANVNFNPNINLTTNNDIIIGKITLNTNNINIETLKYGWLYKTNKITNKNELLSSEIQDWVFFENKEGKFDVDIIKENLEDGYYYLCLMVNNMEFWQCTDGGESILWARYGSFTPEDSNWHVNTIQQAIDYLYQIYN